MVQDDARTMLQDHSPGTPATTMEEEIRASDIVPAALPRFDFETTKLGWRGASSISAFHMLGCLMGVARQQNPEIEIGPVDMSCSFVVCDVKKPGFPIMSVLEAFEKMAGYSALEVMWGSRLTTHQAYSLQPEGLYAVSTCTLSPSSHSPHHITVRPSMAVLTEGIIATRIYQGLSQVSTIFRIELAFSLLYNNDTHQTIRGKERRIFSYDTIEVRRYKKSHMHYTSLIGVFTVAAELTRH